MIAAVGRRPTRMRDRVRNSQPVIPRLQRGHIARCVRPSDAGTMDVATRVHHGVIVGRDRIRTIEHRRRIGRGSILRQLRNVNVMRYDQ